MTKYLFRVSWESRMTCLGSILKVHDTWAWCPPCNGTATSIFSGTWRKVLLALFLGAYLSKQMLKFLVEAPDDRCPSKQNKTKQSEQKATKQNKQWQRNKRHFVIFFFKYSSNFMKKIFYANYQVGCFRHNRLTWHNRFLTYKPTLIFPGISMIHRP